MTCYLLSHILRNKYIIRLFRQIRPYFALRAMDCFDQVYIYSHFVCVIISLKIIKKSFLMPRHANCSRSSFLRQRMLLIIHVLTSMQVLMMGNF